MLDLHRLCRDMSKPKSPLRREAAALIGAAASCLGRPSPRTAALLAGWREDFRVIYGEASLSAHKRLGRAALPRAHGPASYTHPRAHEPGRNPGCRPLAGKIQYCDTSSPR